MRYLAAFAALGLVVACSSGPPPMGTRHLKEKAAAAGEPICRRSPVLGSNKVVRECHTASEWAALAQGGSSGVSEVERTVRAAATADNGSAQ
jgi:hypothetical protein